MTGPFSTDSPLDHWRRAKRVDIAGLCVLMGLPINTHMNPVRVKCPFHGDGDSFNLTIHTTGNKWDGPHVYCYSCGYQGSAIDLVRDYQGMSDREAVEYINGHKLPEVRRMRPEVPVSSTKDMTSAFANANLRLFSDQGARAREYLEGRGIGMDVAHELMLGVWATDDSRWSGRLTIPHLRLPGEAVLTGKGRTLDPVTAENVKYRALKGASQSLYLGERAFAQDDQDSAGIVLVEGEIDAISLHCALRGTLPVCGLPGVQNFRDEHLFMGRRVYVVTDADLPGIRGRDGFYNKQGVWVFGILDRLRQAGAYPVSISPECIYEDSTDLNDMLLAYGPEGLAEWFLKEMQQAEELEVI